MRACARLAERASDGEEGDGEEEEGKGDDGFSGNLHELVEVQMASGEGG